LGSDFDPVPLGFGFPVERLGPRFAAVVDPPGHPSLAFTVACRRHESAGIGVLGVHAPMARSGVVSGVGHLFAASAWSVPPVLNTCP